MSELPYDFTNKKIAKQTIKEVMEVALCQTERLNIEKLIIQAENCGAVTTKKKGMIQGKCLMYSRHAPLK